MASSKPTETLKPGPSCSLGFHHLKPCARTKEANTWGKCSVNTCPRCHILYFIKFTSNVFRRFQRFSHPFRTLQSQSTPPSHSYSTLSIPLHSAIPFHSTPSILDTAILLRPFRTQLFHSGNPIPTPTYCLLDFCFCPFLRFCPFLCFYPFLLFCPCSHLPTVSFVMPVLLSHFLFQFRTYPYLFRI